MNFAFLNKNFTLLDRKQDRILLISVVFVFSVIFLNIFEPFNISRWYSDSGVIQFLRLSSYGFVIAVVFLFTQFPLRRIFKLEQFKVKHFMVWLAIELTLINIIYILLYGNPLGNFRNDLVFSLKYTLLSIWLPYSFAILIVYYKKQGDEIKLLKTSKPQSQENRLIALKDENGKTKFSVQLNDLLYLESSDNYVSVFYFLENKVHRRLLRNSLKNMEIMLKENSFIRCHRSYMVNPKNIELMQNKGKKVNLKIKHLEKTIPVSEKYLSLFSDLLS
jgi:hypothetical protein